MTIRLAEDGPQVLRAATIGEAWLAIAGRIMADGIASVFDDAMQAALAAEPALGADETPVSVLTPG